MSELCWQMHAENEWVLGTKIRGVVRDVVAEIYFDEARDYPWVWLCGEKRGEESTFWRALEEAEEASSQIPSFWRQYRKMARAVSEVLSPESNISSDFGERASGKAVCDICGLDYFEHPTPKWAAGLTLTCDGRLWHL